MAVGPGHSVPATVANTREETSVFSLLSDITPDYQKGSGCFQLQITQLEPGSAGFRSQPGSWDSSVTSPGDRESTTKACVMLSQTWRRMFGSISAVINSRFGSSALCAVLLLLTWSDSSRNVSSLSGELH